MNTPTKRTPTKRPPRPRPPRRIVHSSCLAEAYPSIGSVKTAIGLLKKETKTKRVWCAPWIEAKKKQSLKSGKGDNGDGYILECFPKIVDRLVQRKMFVLWKIESPAFQTTWKEKHIRFISGQFSAIGDDCRQLGKTDEAIVYFRASWEFKRTNRHFDDSQGE